MKRGRGRPVGSTTDRVWQDALRKAAFDLSEGRGSPKKIEIAARALVTAACAGDIAAAREMGDRLDGKPRQQIQHAGHDGGPLDLSVMSDEDLDRLAGRLAAGIDSSR